MNGCRCLQNGEKKSFKLEDATGYSRCCFELNDCNRDDDVVSVVGIVLFGMR